MRSAKTLMAVAMLAQMGVAAAQAEPLVCFTQFSDVFFAGDNNTRMLLPYNQCLSYIGSDGVYVRAQAHWGTLTARGRIFSGDVYCRPGSCLRPHY